MSRTIDTSESFFVLDSAPEGETLRARTDALTMDNPKLGEAPRCPACGQYTGGMSWLPPFRVELRAWGREFGDLAFVSADEILVSERSLALWHQNRLVGLSGFEQVDVEKVQGDRQLVGKPPRYFRAAVKVTRAEIDYDSSGFEWERPPDCPECRLGHLLKRWRRILIKPGTWTGEDLFIPFQMNVFLASKRFKQFCEANEITNAVFLPAEEYGHDFYPDEAERD